MRSADATTPRRSAARRHRRTRDRAPRARGVCSPDCGSPTSGRPTSLIHREQLPRAGHTLQLVLPARRERDAGSGHEVDHRARNQYFTGIGVRLDARGQMHCNAGNIVTSPFDLARVQPDTNVETELARAIAEGAPALDRSRRTVKCRQKPVAKALYPTPAEATHLTHCHIVVLVEQLPPGPVAGQRGASGRVDNVAEENR